MQNPVQKNFGTDKNRVATATKLHFVEDGIPRRGLQNL